MHVKNGFKGLKRYPQISRRVRDTLARLLLPNEDKFDRRVEYRIDEATVRSVGAAPAQRRGMTCAAPHSVPPCSAGPRASYPPARLASAKHPGCAAGPSHLWGYAWRSPARHRGIGCRAQQTVLDEFLGPEKHAGRAARSRNLSACFCRPNFHHEPRRPRVPLRGT